VPRQVKTVRDRQKMHRNIDVLNEVFRLTEEGRAIVARRQGALVERGNTSAWLRFKSWLFRRLHVYDEVTGRLRL
jgi:hypothetical protein